MLVELAGYVYSSKHLKTRRVAHPISGSLKRHFAGGQNCVGEALIGARPSDEVKKGSAISRCRLTTAEGSNILLVRRYQNLRGTHPKHLRN